MRSGSEIMYKSQNRLHRTIRNRTIRNAIFKQNTLTDRGESSNDLPRINILKIDWNSILSCNIWVVGVALQIAYIHTYSLCTELSPDWLRAHHLCSYRLIRAHQGPQVHRSFDLQNFVQNRLRTAVCPILLKYRDQLYCCICTAVRIAIIRSIFIKTDQDFGPKIVRSASHGIVCFGSNTYFPIYKPDLEKDSVHIIQWGWLLPGYFSSQYRSVLGTKRLVRVSTFKICPDPKFLGHGPAVIGH